MACGCPNGSNCPNGSYSTYQDGDHVNCGHSASVPEREVGSRDVSLVQPGIELLAESDRRATCEATAGLAVSGCEVSSAREALGNAVQW